MANPATLPNAVPTRRLAAAACLALSIAAIVVHGRASRPAQPQFAGTIIAVEAAERPERR